MSRPLFEIAREIASDWESPHYTAIPYLEAMGSLRGIGDSYGADDAESVVMYFLSNAGKWRTPTAKAIKAELRGMLKSLKRASGDTLQYIKALASVWPGSVTVSRGDRGFQSENFLQVGLETTKLRIPGIVPRHVREKEEEELVKGRKWLENVAKMIRKNHPDLEDLSIDVSSKGIQLFAVADSFVDLDIPDRGRKVLKKASTETSAARVAAAWSDNAER